MMRSRLGLAAGASAAASSNGGANLPAYTAATLAAGNATTGTTAQQSQSQSPSQPHIYVNAVPNTMPFWRFLPSSWPFSRSALYATCLALAAVVLVLNLFGGMLTQPITTVRDHTGTFDHTRFPSGCGVSDESTAIFNLKTKLQVTYDAGHWFHMAENFLTEHSKQRKLGRLTNASTIVFNFDADNFVEKLNGVTRLLVVLSSTLSGQNLHTVHFIHSPAMQSLAATAKIGEVISIKQNAITSQQTISLLSSDLSADRFIQSPASNYKPLPGTMCAKFMGSIGGNWPTVQRGHWFPNPGDVSTLRTKIESLCPIANANSQDTNKAMVSGKRKLVIYQRDMSRKIANEAEAIQWIRQQLSPDKWSIEILMHSSRRSPCSIREALAGADVLLTSHGFQSMLLLLLPPQAILFEVFPYKYYKRAYGPLGGEYGVIHGGAMSPPVTWLSKMLLRVVPTGVCMKSKQCRNYARNHDVIMTPGAVDKLMTMIKMRFS